MEFTLAGWWASSFDNSTMIVIVAVGLMVLFVLASTAMTKFKKAIHQILFFAGIFTLVYVGTSAAFYLFETCKAGSAVELIEIEDLVEDNEVPIQEPKIEIPTKTLPTAEVKCYQNGQLYYSNIAREGITVTDHGYSFVEADTGIKRTVPSNCHLIER